MQLIGCLPAAVAAVVIVVGLAEECGEANHWLCGYAIGNGGNNDIRVCTCPSGDACGHWNETVARTKDGVVKKSMTIQYCAEPELAACELDGTVTKLVKDSGNVVSFSASCTACQSMEVSYTADGTKIIVENVCKIL